MEQNYLNSLRVNLEAAADRKAVERKAEAKAQRLAKILVIGLLLTIAVIVMLFGDSITNWS